jgi:hypothetical protein
MFKRTKEGNYLPQAGIPLALLFFKKHKTGTMRFSKQAEG